MFFKTTRNILGIQLLVWGALPQISLHVTEDFEIPIPPLKIQEEIVRILDNFTELTNELTLRRKQYEYYRDKLLSFDGNMNGGGYDKIALTELFDMRNGYTPSTSNPDFWTDGTIPWFVMEDIRRNGRVLSDSMQHVTTLAVRGAGLFPANSIIVATSATVGEHALITRDFLCNQRFTCLSPKAEFKERIDMKFMFYYAFKLDEFCRHNTTQSSFASVDMKNFRRFEIPLPPLDVQERIVNVLDNFDAICSDLGIGLPAEIEKRRQQYEYYRDLLLTFSERGDTILNRTDEIKLLQYVFGFAFVRLGEIATITRGTRVTRNQLNTKDGYPVYQNSLNPLGFYNKFNRNENTTFVICAGAAGEIGYSNSAFWAADDCFSIDCKENLNSRYVYHYLLNCQAHIVSQVRRSSIPRLAHSVIENLILVLPPIEEQKRIVEILDRFDNLCNDISEGLPAETEARKKQYEYYRDRLLSFDEMRLPS